MSQNNLCHLLVTLTVGILCCAHADILHITVYFISEIVRCFYHLFQLDPIFALTLTEWDYTSFSVAYYEIEQQLI